MAKETLVFLSMTYHGKFILPLLYLHLMQKMRKKQKIVYSEPREIHEICKFTRFNQITIPKNLRKILKLDRGDKIYWVRCQKKPHADEVFNITIRAIHTKEGT